MRLVLAFMEPMPRSAGLPRLPWLSPGVLRLSWVAATCTTRLPGYLFEVVVTVVAGPVGARVTARATRNPQKSSASALGNQSNLGNLVFFRLRGVSAVHAPPCKSRPLLY